MLQRGLHTIFVCDAVCCGPYYGVGTCKVHGHYVIMVYMPTIFTTISGELYYENSKGHFNLWPSPPLGNSSSFIFQDPIDMSHFHLKTCLGEFHKQNRVKCTQKNLS